MVLGADANPTDREEFLMKSGLTGRNFDSFLSSRKDSARVNDF